MALLHLLATLSFQLGDFTLASGRHSDYYIDCRVTTLHAEGGRLAGLLLYDLLREHFPTAAAVGGLTMGADPLVANIASASAWAAADHAEIRELSRELNLDYDASPETDPDTDPKDSHSNRASAGPADDDAPSLVHGFLVRKSEKSHGTGRLLEGFTRLGSPVVIVDDVCTTGGSTIAAIEATQAAGMTVLGVLCLVDREQGGRAAIKTAAPHAPFHALFTAGEIRASHIDLHR